MSWRARWRQALRTMLGPTWASRSPRLKTRLWSFVANQLQNSVANGRAAFSSSSGATALVYSLGQMNIDAALFAASQAVGGTGAALESPLAKLLKISDTSDYQICQSNDGLIIFSIPRGAVQPEGSSCKDPKTFVPLPDCVPLQKPSAERPCTPPEPFKPLTPAECNDQPHHHVSGDGNTCVPDGKQGCPALPNGVQGVNPFCTPVPIKGSIDPNAKSGPFGPGAQHFHTSRTSFSYSVEFENEPTASLPAQRVLVTNQLDTVNLDLSTFSLGPITFGSYTLTPPADAQHFSGGLDLRPDQNLIVKVDASLNIATGAVTWRFSTLDPDTEQVTTDPAAGFLPPDTAPPQGEGNLLYSIHPKLSIASGATVCNQATVVFDANAPINTQNWCNTIDDIAPVSSVTRLPSTQANVTFPVQWSGTDTGSGILHYTVYVSDNGAPYVAWQTDTTATQASYPGTTGHTYAFYSIATDNVGNVEAAKSAAEATTTISAAAIVPSSLISTTASGLAYSRVTQTFNGTVTITNISSSLITGPVEVVITSLTPGVTLGDASGTFAGNPFITVLLSGSLGPGQSATSVQFKIPRTPRSTSRRSYTLGALINMCQRAVLFFALFIWIASSASADVIYEVTVDTLSISGTPGSLDFQFNTPARLRPSPHRFKSSISHPMGHWRTALQTSRDSVPLEMPAVDHFRQLLPSIMAPASMTTLTISRLTQRFPSM